MIMITDGEMFDSLEEISRGRLNTVYIPRPQTLDPSCYRGILVDVWKRVITQSGIMVWMLEGAIRR